MQKISKLILVTFLCLVILGACKKDSSSTGEQASLGQLFNEEGLAPGMTAEEMELLKTYNCPQVESFVCAEGKSYINACEAAKAGESQWSMGQCV